MSIRFKFRSSVNFDSVDIEGRSSISVRDLKSMIIRQNHLNICRQDFDLVFSDALSGREYNDETFQIPSGSSVIIKRVPAGRPASAMEPFELTDKFGMKDSCKFSPRGNPPVGGQLDEFDDFGVDLCYVPEATSPGVDLGIFNSCNINGATNMAGSRLGSQRVESTNLIEPVLKGSNHCQIEGRIHQKKLESEVEDTMKLANVVNVSPVDGLTADLPSELKCSLCLTYFKEAVMIPCCQHSFCEKCIHLVLIEKARCPKCSSSKCGVKDLLPNLSLRQAIEHLLEAQDLIHVSESALRKDAPDGESGIQAKDFSCAVTIARREMNVPNSSSATERGSNKIMADSVYESLSRKKASGLAAGVEFQGENQPLYPSRTFVHDEADSAIHKKRPWVDTGGGEQSFMANGRLQKVDKTCYKCGSPDHFIRDCPFASNSHGFLQMGNAMFPQVPGYLPPYWNGSALPTYRPFSNMFSNPGMIPFNPALVPASPFCVPPYVPSMYRGFPGAGRMMRMDHLVTPVGPRVGQGPVNSEFLELQNSQKRQMFADDDSARTKPCDREIYNLHEGDHHDEPRRSHACRSDREMERSVSYSEDSTSDRHRRKICHDKHMDRDIRSINERRDRSSRSSNAGKDPRSHLSERSNSGVEDLPNSSDRFSEGIYKHDHRSSRKHHSHHHKQKDYHDKRRAECDAGGFTQKHQGPIEMGSESSSSDKQRRHNKEKDSESCSRHGKRSEKVISNDLCDDRWQMFSGSDDHMEGYHHHKRKRVH